MPVLSDLDTKEIIVNDLQVWSLFQLKLKYKQFCEKYPSTELAAWKSEWESMLSRKSDPESIEHVIMAVEYYMGPGFYTSTLYAAIIMNDGKKSEWVAEALRQAISAFYLWVHLWHYRQDIPVLTRESVRQAYFDLPIFSLAPDMDWIELILNG